MQVQRLPFLEEGERSGSAGGGVPVFPAMRDDMRYAPSDCFETFPFAEHFETNPTLESAGQAYYEFLAALMVKL